MTGRAVTLRLSVTRAVCRLVVAGLLYGAAALVYEAATGGADPPPFAGVVGVTVVVALALWLLKDPVDRLAARAVLGARADGYEVMRELTAQLAATLPVDEVAPRLAEAASRTTGRPRAEVRLWLTDGDPWARSWPPTEATILNGTAVEVRHSGAALGEIAVEGDDLTQGALSSWDRRMLDTLARPAGAALSTVRLTVELRQRKSDLERLTVALTASRERLLTARAREQQRMRAEVEARVGTHLSAALAALDGGATGVREASLSTVASEAGLALDELRIVARGIYPPTLTEVGLAASLQSWLARAQVDATLDAPAELPGIDPSVAACLYFCAVTSLAHLARHQASGIRVGVADRPAPSLRIEAHADDRVARDTIEVVTDRIEAFGGSVDSDRGEHRFGLVATLPTRTDGPS